MRLDNLERLEKSHHHNDDEDNSGVEEAHVQIEGLAEAVTKIEFEGDEGRAAVVESRRNYLDVLRQISEQLEQFNDSTAGGDFDSSLYTLGEKFADLKDRIEEVVEKPGDDILQDDLD
jgi:hypothetical protein